MSILNIIRGKKSLTKGFTLVELLVVIAIIGVLATLILLQLGSARQKARDAKRVADINQVRSAEELFFDDNGRYSITMELTADLVTVGRYMALMPLDPLTPGCDTPTNAYDAGGCYGYAWDPAGFPIRFHVWAELERRSTAHNADLDFDSATPLWPGAPVNANNSALTPPREPCANTLLTDAECEYDIGQTQ